MKTLFESFKELRYSYYGIAIQAEERFVSDSVRDEYINHNHTDSERCRAFIREHFENGAKKEALNVSFKSCYESPYDQNAFRHVHMVSLYLLGLALEQCFCRQLKTSLEHCMDCSKWYDFQYTWFLTCLYHDTATFVECVTSDSNEATQQQLCELLESNDITYTPFKHQPIRESARLVRYNEELVSNYFAYRIGKNERDHGIFAGYLLFDLLVKNFYQETEGHDWNISRVHRKCGLKWRQEHLDHFAYIADAIICHNMWTVSAKDEAKAKEYEKAGLKALVITNPEDRLKLSENPLQFMLCLLDTIEPVKRFAGQLSAKEVLSNIAITKESDACIKIAWKKSLMKQDGFYKWMSGIQGMEHWMNVCVSECRCSNQQGECYVTIDF